MAHLDVRERRIEATIAYLGPELAGRTTNLRRLGGMSDRAEGERSPTDDVVSIEWRPVGMTRFDDCDVAVRIVAPRGGLSEDLVTHALHEADGVVLVLDADPAAQERNRTWLEPARLLLGTRQGAPRPVVVQVNKADLPDAVPLAELLADLGLADWPHVLASATRGEGVVETVRCALENVLGLLEAHGPVDGLAQPPPRADAHPLLGALRQVLRECIDERVGAIEERLVERVAQTAAERVAPLVGELAGLTRSLAEVQAQVAAVRTAQREAVLRLGAEIGGIDKRLAAEMAASEGRLALAIAAGATEDACRAGDLRAAEERLREGLAATSREERDHVTAASAAMRKSLDALRVELRPRDVSAELTGIDARIQSVAEKIEEASAALLPAAGVLRSLPLRLGESQDRTRNAVLAQLDELGRRVEGSVEALGAEAAPVWARIDERSTKVDAAVEEMIEELKKPKKGWFR